MSDHVDDVKRHFHDESERLVPPAVDAAKLASRVVRARRVRSISIVGAMVLVVLGSYVLVDSSQEPRSVQLVEPSGSDGSDDPAGAVNLTPSSAPSDLPNEASPTPAAPKPPTAAKPYEIVSTEEALVSQDINGVFDVYRIGGAGPVLVSVTDDEEPGRCCGESFTSKGAMSADGRYVAFYSDATNIAPSGWGIFVRDIEEGSTTSIPTEYEGERLNNLTALRISMAADGHRFAFTAGTNPCDDFLCTSKVFVRDTEAEETLAASVSESGELIGGTEPDISSDGRLVVFTGPSSGSTAPCNVGKCRAQILLRDLDKQTTELISVAPDGSQGNAPSGSATFKPSGLIRFLSCATNLIDPNDPTPPPIDCDLESVFLRDRGANKTTQLE